MPPTLRTLAQAVGNSLRSISKSAWTPPIINKAYEAYCFSIAFETLREIGFAPFAEQLQNGVFVFPRAPRPIVDNQVSYVRLEGGPSSAVELHANAYALGTSGHVHEMDIGVVDRKAAERCRRQGSQLRKGKVWAVVECKCYDSNLGAGIGREFLGLVKELGGGRQYFALMTSYPWRSVAFDIVRKHGRKYLVANPDRMIDTASTREAFKSDMSHLLGRV